MSKMNPIERSKYINARYKEYLKSSFEFNSEKLQKLFHKQLQEEALFKGPYVDLNLPFARGASLGELIEEGVISKTFKLLGNMNFERPLYSHQEEAIRRVKKGRSAIITTGTGSGKTESFLYPILNELSKDVELNNSEKGIRAILLYPMNALVNDQIDRLREILSQCPEITYGFFTGETKETISANYRQKMFEETGKVIPENELVSREEIRSNPPHLLFTNYSMLEFLLIRPGDATIFKPSMLNNWKFVVLDEAHSYYGSKGIELAWLMRRLTGLAAKKPQFLLTSATLGEQGKSEKDIVEFAKNLTSVNFDEEDIIFSKRIPLRKQVDNYTVKGSEYLELKKSLKNIDDIKGIVSKYLKTDSSTVNSCLYDLLKNDNNVYKIYEALKIGTKSFSKIYPIFSNEVKEDEIVALIDLINLAEKDGIGIFDLKYHSFIRPLSGAFITLGDGPKVSLTKSNSIEGKKAFELGNCRYCSAPYIIGKIKKNETDQLEYLYQNSEIDIYENYGINEFVSIDYFLLEKTSEVEGEVVEDNLVEEYKVCTKCGCLYAADNLNAAKCKCENTEKHSIYKVITNKKKDGPAKNNISYCHSCGHKGRTGIVKSLNVGKDEGTAIVAQLLFEAIDEKEEIKTNPKPKAKLSLKLGESKEVIAEKAETKQFLAFSDSRQQASFAATFFDSNHTRMLRKRLIWRVIEEKNYSPISVDELIAELTAINKREELFDNSYPDSKNAWITVLIDLLKVDGNFDGEGLGLYYFDLDLDEIMENISEEDVEEEFREYGIDKDDIFTIMQVVFGMFKTVPAINYTNSPLSSEDKKETLEYRKFDNYVQLRSSKTINGVKSFLPVNLKENKLIRYINKIFNCDSKKSEEIIEMLFNNLAMDGGLLTRHPSEDTYQIKANKFIIKNYKTSQYFQCSKCRNVTPYNVKNACPQDKCDGMLTEINPDEALETNFYRSEYKNKKIERISIKEHTAQLNREIAKTYQENFKNKAINILSCSTTFEMGIDIGDLENVLMRNVPPSPANYVQRAGRAGRRKDSAAYILTYCSSTSHDYTYFCKPEDMISGVINPPYFNINNPKIIKRHLMATSLGFFFRENPDYFNSIKELVFQGGVEEFEKYINSKPFELSQFIDNRILKEAIFDSYKGFKWLENLGVDEDKLKNFVDSIKGIEKEYKKAKEVAIAEEQFKEAHDYNEQVEKIYKEKVISALSKYCVIPKYGFPVDLINLEIWEHGKINPKYDLNRDLKIGISEYAPDSEIIVDGNKYTSKYITLPKTAPFAKNYFIVCPECKKANVFLSERTKEKCKYCFGELEGGREEVYIKPIHGFKTGLTKESAHMKPKRSYAGEVSYVGGGTIDDNNFKIGRNIGIETSRNDELLVLNRSNFYMCQNCGYSEISNSKIQTPKIFKQHKNYKQFTCTCEDLQRIKLGHTFQTDVARFNIPILSADSSDDYDAALSFMYAFLEGISKALEIERGDIDGILEINPEQYSFDLLIYDNVPGGAGHIKRLVNKEAIEKSLNAAKEKVDQTCCDEETTCYNCLRNYYNQAYHNKLQRRLAKNIIEKLIRSIDD